MLLPLAVATEDFGVDLRRALDSAVQLNVPGVRLNSRTELNAHKATDSELRQILRYINERQMSVAGLYCPTRHALYEEQFLEPRLEVIRKSMEIAQKLKTKELLVRCGPVSLEKETTRTENQIQPADSFEAVFSSVPPTPQRSPHDEFEMLCELLNDLAGYGDHVGCVLTLVLNDYDYELIRHLIDRVTRGRIQVVFDPATAIMNGNVPTNIFRDIHETVGYVRCRDAVTNVDGGGIETAIGKGIVDWDELIPTLFDAEFTGWTCIERTGGEFRADDVKAGVTYLKSLTPEVGN